MAMISLRDYNREIESLVESNQIDEAISHCVAILRSFPKSIDTYRNLGKALLESKRYPEAADVFSKVLSAFPDDFISHIGLSVIEEENRNLDAAIWHMEQAFELQPSNLALQEELRRLFGRRDGVPPVKIRLTRGALVKMYARGDLYQQAIAEIKSVLKDEPSRIDFKVLLAKMYQVSGASNEAVETASEIVAEYPYCFEADRILDELLAVKGQEKEKNVYRERLVSLNPYYQFVDAITSDPADVPAEKIMLDKQEYSPSFSAERDVSDWSKQIGINWQEKDAFASSEPSSILDQVDAFSEIASEPEEKAPVSPFIGEITPEIGSNVEEKSQNESEPLPDWITKAGWTRSEGNSEQPEEHFDESASESGSQAPAAPSEDLPDWLKAFKPDDSGEQVNFEHSEITPPAISDILPEESSQSFLSSDELKNVIDNLSAADRDEEKPSGAEESSDKSKPEWLNQFGEETNNASSQESENNLPGWLKNFQKEESTPSSPQEEQPDWLSSLKGEETTPEVPETVQNESPADEEQPDWLSSLKGEETTPEVPETVQNESPADEEQPDWLSSLKGEESEPETPEPVQNEAHAEEEQPDWLSSLKGEETTPEVLESIQNESPAEEEQPDWLSALKPEEKEETPSEFIETEPPADDEDVLRSLDNILGNQESEPISFASDEKPELSESVSKESSPDVSESSASALPAKQENNQQSDKSSIPSWVKNILSTPPPPTPQEEEIKPAPSPEPPENSNQPFDEMANLVSDLPDQSGAKGAISTEANDDLISWLREINPESEDSAEGSLPIEFETEKTVEDFSVEDRIQSSVSKEDISEILPDSDAQEFNPELEKTEEPEFEDRLSNLLDQSAENNIAEESAKEFEPTENFDEIPSEEVAIDRIFESAPEQAAAVESSQVGFDDQMAVVLNSSDLSSISTLVDQSLSRGTPIEEIINSMKSSAQQNPMSYELWQELGDLYHENLDFDNALMAYNKAAQILQI